MIKRALKFLGLCLLLLVVVAVVSVGYLLGTEQGMRQALALGQRYAPGTLTWHSAGGRLVGPLQVSGLRYRQDDGLVVVVDSMHLDWTPSALLARELVVGATRLDGVEVRLPESSAPVESTSTNQGGLPEIVLPVDVRLDELAITDVALFPPGQDTAVQIERLALSGTADATGVHVSNVEIVAPQGQVRLAGDVQPWGAYPMDLTLDWQSDLARLLPVEADGSATNETAASDAPLAGQGTIIGNLDILNITHEVSGVAPASIAARVENVLTLPGWDADIDVNLALPDALPIEGLSALLTSTPELSLQSRGTLDDFDATIALVAATTETGPIRLDSNIGGTTRQLEVRSLTAKLADSGAEFNAQGQVQLETLVGELQGEWRRLGWPLVGEQDFRSAEGEFQARGSAEAFTLTLRADVGGDTIPDGNWQLALDGSATQLDRFTLLGDTLEGTISANGRASWEDVPRWDVQLATDAINPGAQWADFPGSIDLNLATRGELRDDGPELAIDIERLGGSLRGQKLAGDGQFRFDNERAAVAALDVTLGPTRLVAGGLVNEELSLAFDLTSTDLGTLMPGLGGAIALTGTVSGDRQAPVFAASGNADRLAYADNTVLTLAIALDGGLASDVVSTLSLSVTDIHAGGQTIGRVSLTGDGTQSDHRLALSIASEQGDIATELEGRYMDNAWQGTLTTLRLDNTPAGNWTLRKPVSLSASAAEAAASPLCLAHVDGLGRLCAEGNWLADGASSLLLTLENLSPDLAAAYLPAGITVRTALDGQASVSLDDRGELAAESRLTLQPGRLAVDSSGTPLEIGLEQTTLDAVWRDDTASVQLDGAFTDIGDVSVQATLTNPAGAGELKGQIDIDFTDLTLISAVAPQVQEITGALSSDLTLAGTLDAPVIEGELALMEFGAEIPETAMVIEDTQVRVTGGRDGVLKIAGESHSGGGRLGISGTVTPATQVLDLAIQGENYQVANTAMIRALISPDFTVIRNENGMRVDGSLTIPSAYINANGGNEGIRTVSASSDVVFVSEEDDDAAPEADSAASQVRVDMQIVLGDDIEIEAGDFRGRVEGDLRIEQSPGTAPRGTGTIDVVNGDFVVYGQQLNMERGRILFGGGPVDNPTLDMEVAREVPEFDVVAGARIKGTAQAPRLELYAEPSMPDASILSFILRGQPPDSMGASYTLGKYLTPVLYVSYGIGLFDAINTFNMRYTLTEGFSLEAESGGGSSADLIYTIER